MIVTTLNSERVHIRFAKCGICGDYPPLQPFPLQKTREVHGLLVGRKWNPTQIITNYSVGGERAREGEITSLYDNKDIRMHTSAENQKKEEQVRFHVDCSRQSDIWPELTRNSTLSEQL